MKKTKKLLAIICTMALLVETVPCRQAEAAAKFPNKACVGGAASISVNCSQGDVVTFQSDDSGMTYEQTGHSSVIIGAFSIFSYGFDIKFSTPGNHTLTMYLNGNERDKTSFEVFSAHSWTESVTRQATCKEDGEKKLTCSNCGEEKTETIPKVDHNYVADGEVKATCHNAGYTQTKCSMCGDIQKTDYPQLEHRFSDWTVEKEATIFEDGEEAQTCSLCGDKNVRKIEKLPSSVALEKQTLKLKKGKKATLKISDMTDGDSVKSFTSSKKSIATVTKSGKVTAKKKGKTTITLTMKSGCKATCKVTVK